MAFPVAGTRQFIDNADIYADLKVLYKDPIESLITRNSPVLSIIPTLKWEGALEWMATYAASPAAGYSFLAVEKQALQTGKNVNWHVEPYNMWAILTISVRELVAVRSQKGGYMRILGLKTFSALEGLRKQLAKGIYGRIGEIGTYSGANVDLSAAGAKTITLTEDQTIGLVPGSQIRILSGGFAGTLTPAIAQPPITVATVDDEKITTTNVLTYTLTAGDVLVYEGTYDSSGQLQAFPGLSAWLPDRTAADYNAQMSSPFLGVPARNVAPSALGGQFYQAAAGEKKMDAVMKLLRKCRRAGGDPDTILINDIDAASLVAEYETQRTQFINADQGPKSSTVHRGAKSANFTLWTSILDKLIDDPYCPAKHFFVLRRDDLQLVCYTNLERTIQNGNITEEPGRADPMAENDAKEGEQPDNILIDDIVTIKDGEATDAGPVKEIIFNLLFSLVVWNTANCGHGLFIN